MQDKKKPQKKQSKPKKNVKTLAKEKQLTLEKMYTTGDIMNVTGLGRQTLHTYRQLGLIKPVNRNDKGKWFYDVEVFAIIKKILRWQLHRALTEVAEIFKKLEKNPKIKRLGVFEEDSSVVKIEDPLHPPKYYTIGEVIQVTGLTRQVLHNYIVQGLIHEISRTKSGHRLFDEEVFSRIQLISRYKRHMTLDEVKVKIDEHYNKAED